MSKKKAKPGIDLKKVQLPATFKTANDMVATVFGRHVDGEYFCGFIHDQHLDGARTWDSNGKCVDENDWHLTKPWKEPVRVKGFVRVCLTPDEDGDHAIGNYIFRDRKRCEEVVKQNPGSGIASVELLVEEVK